MIKNPEFQTNPLLLASAVHTNLEKAMTRCSGDEVKKLYKSKIAELILTHIESK